MLALKTDSNLKTELKFREIVIQKLNEIKTICSNISCITSYTRELLFLEVFKIYIKAFECINAQTTSYFIDTLIEELKTEYFQEGQIIEKIKSYTNIKFDFSPAGQYELIIQTYGTYIKDLLSDIDELNVCDLSELKFELSEIFFPSVKTISTNDFRDFSENYKFEYVIDKIDDLILNFKN